MDGLKFFTPLWFHLFQWKHCNENTGIFQWGFEWECRGLIRILCTLPCLTWVEGLKYYIPLWFHPFGWKQRGIAGGSQCEYHKITGNVWVEPWVGLQGANKSAHWDGWEIENPLELYCTYPGSGLTDWPTRQSICRGWLTNQHNGISIQTK